jgi:hypothetical protein
MQIEYILIVVITIIANAVFEFLGYGMSKVVVKISISPLSKFWKPFLRDGGIIVIPPYPKKRPDFSVKHGTGYNDCIASGEIRKFLALMGKDIEVKENIPDYNQNLIVIGGPISNPAFSKACIYGNTAKEVEPSIVFEKCKTGNKIEYKIVNKDDGKEYFCNEKDDGYGLLYLYKDIGERKNTFILIAGCHGPNTKKFGEILTTKEYRKKIKKIRRYWRKQNYFPTACVLKYSKIGDPPPKVEVICEAFKINKNKQYNGEKVDKKE